jgi:hypothetical protein
MDAGWLRQSLAHSPLSCREQVGASGSSTKLGALDHDSSARSVAAVIFLSRPLAYPDLFDAADAQAFSTRWIDAKGAP